MVWFGDVVSVGAERESSEGALLTVVEKKGRLSQYLFVKKFITLFSFVHGGITEEENAVLSLNI